MNNSGNGISWRSAGNGGDTTLTARSERHNRGAIHVVFLQTAFPAEANAPCEDGESTGVRRGEVAGGVETRAVSLAAGRRDEPMTVERRRHGQRLISPRPGACDESPSIKRGYDFPPVVEQYFAPLGEYRFDVAATGSSDVRASRGREVSGCAQRESQRAP
jgi:hypothetical protein